MENRWNPAEAAQYQTDLDLRVYSSRLLGQDPSLVLHGGGNTSVKVTETNIVGESEEILYVKGSGWDLATIEAAGFAPVRMAHLLKLAKLDRLSDPQMVNELKTQMTNASAPSPSVETILHAILPYKYVDHTHADAVVTVTNTANGWERIEEIYGDRLVIIPYVMPGFDLARLCAEKFTAEAGPQTLGMVLMNHGIFSFGATAKESYDRMIELVAMAETYLAQQGAIQSFTPGTVSHQDTRQNLAQLRYDLSQTAGFPVILATHTTPKTLAFAQRGDLTTISQQGPATPDHVIRTKRLPLIGRDVAAYKSEYQAYFQTHAQPGLTMLDPAPRVILDPEWGLCTVGRSVQAAAIVADIYDHTIDVISQATALGGYQALPAADLFAVEYWDLEQAKLRKGGNPPQFTGEIALVTGAASGIGKACAEALLKKGAAVVGLDIDPAIVGLFDRPDFCGIPCDLTDEGAISTALEKAVRQFGGVDLVVLNAGIFPPSRAIAHLDLDHWRKVMAINLDANLTLLRELYPCLKFAPQGGRVVVIGSKNVPAPGPGVAAYSAAKAALTQLMRVAALEWGGDGIRINAVHPNGVFDTGIWTEEVLQARAAHYGLSVADYKTNNLLKVEVTSAAVADVAIALCTPLFACTTGAQIPIDGGNERVI
ncbi:bifunctional aldolase/short-chain dehydrogenase [Spirulina sp. CCNP1310]|uniref:bifunctional aldolase/short-chain dehydrogenase n=1 Tax=Spirulina sp. CCNP1310 TaxID=3110249 RepID=UPI002B202DCF|nr:bifunctional aldolase/short-chain dehydrogenase [Spirulina sp. CCNP1310]MEA5418109.1 bifunctional aldolase/short-chain dehydrogenase [Spirulina sp. CCNP1310]